MAATYQSIGRILIAIFGTILLFAAFIAYLFYSVPSKQKSPASSCMSQMKQIGLAITQYSMDNDDRYPPRNSISNNAAVSWRKSIDPYVKSANIYECPANPVRDIPDIEKDGYTRSYAVNSTSPTVNTLGGPYADRKNTISINAISKIESVIMITETTAAFSDFNVLNKAAFTRPTNSTHNTGNLFAGHKGCTSMLFADCHVKQMNPQDTLTSNRNMWSIDGKAFNNTDEKTANRVLQYSMELYKD